MAGVNMIDGLPEDGELLIRIDERIKTLSDRFSVLERKLSKEYVKQSEFWPVRTLVYSSAGAILVGVLGAILTVVIR